MSQKVTVGEDTVSVYRLDPRRATLLWQHPVSGSEPDGSSVIRPACQHEINTYIVEGVGRVRASLPCRHDVIVVQDGLTDEQAETVTKALAHLAWGVCAE